MTERIRPLGTLLNRVVVAENLPGEAIYKDWILSFFLEALANDAVFGPALVFKGGTSLRKVHCADWRYSEDLDFSSVEPLDCVVGEAHMQRVCDAVVSRLAESAGAFTIAVRLAGQQPHPTGQCEYLCDITFPFGRRTTIKIEITVDEPVLLTPVRKPIRHAYAFDPLPGVEIRSYQLAEIVAEKLRAFLQAQQHWIDRGWVRPRSRDTWDLARLYEASLVDLAAVRRLLPAKAAVRGVTYENAEAFRAPAVRQVYGEAWQRTLDPMVPPTLRRPYAECVAVVDQLLDDLFAANTTEPQSGP